MKSALTIGVFTALCASAAAWSQASAPSKSEPAAAAACERGQGDRFGHPSNGCWAAHDAAIVRGDHARALRYARAGCEKYARADLCLYVRTVDADSRSHVVAVAHGASSAQADAMNRAVRHVHAVDLEDAERGILLRALHAEGAARRP